MDLDLMAMLMKLEILNFQVKSNQYGFRLSSALIKSSANSLNLTNMDLDFTC